MGITSGLISAGGALMGLFGGGDKPSDVQLPPQFNMPNMGAAANQAFGGINALAPYTSLASGTLPYAQQVFQGQFNNPFAGQFQGGAGVASNLGQSAALGAYGAGGNLMGAGLNALPYAQQIATSAFDPQQALYNRTVQQLQDQVRAGEGARGIATTPYGAGLENQALSNFNIDWQNNLLNRQLQGTQGIGNILSQGGGAINLGAGIANQAPGQFLQASGMPYATSLGILGNQQGGINNLLQTGTAGANLANVPINDYLAYIQSGNQAGGVANQQAQLALNQQQQGFNQNMQFGQQLGGALYRLGGGGYGGGFNMGNSPMWSGIGGLFG